MKNLLKSQINITYNMILLMILAVLFIIFGVLNNNFFSFGYILESIKLIIEIGIMAFPVTLIIIIGGTDFSMSAILSLSALCGGLVAAKMGAAAGIFTSLLIGSLCGFFNGVLIAVFKIQALVATIATMYLYKGIAIGLTLGIPGMTVGGTVFSWNTTNFLGNASVLGLPLQVWIFILLGVGFHIVLSKTYIGRWLYAIGRNENAIIFSGVNTKKIKLALHTIGGITFSIAGLIFLGRFTSIKYDSADAYILQVITAVVLGGTSIAGGFGNIKGTAISVMILAVLKGGLNIMLVPQTQQKIVIGIILLASLIVFAVIEKNATKHIRKETTDYSEGLAK